MPWFLSILSFFWGPVAGKSATGGRRAQMTSIHSSRQKILVRSPRAPAFLAGKNSDSQRAG
jgi:hypothetical protein